MRFTDRTAEGFVVAGYRERGAVALKVDPAPKERFTISAEVQLQGLAQQTGEAHVFLAHEGLRDSPWERFLEVVVRPDGIVLLNAYADGVAQPRWSVQERVAAGLLPPGERVPLKVTVDAKSIVVEVGAKRVLDAAVP